MNVKTRGHLEATVDTHKEYANLLNIPQNIIFPLELSIHLKERLQLALEEIFRLKKQIHQQDYETSNKCLQAEKIESERYIEAKEVQKSGMSNVQMATKVVELSKKVRDMTAEQESMKTRMKQLMAENEFLKDKGCDNSKVEASNNPDKKNNSEEDLLSTSQQLATTTNKMMDYRRQSQQLRIELRTALKALSQEVGEGTTPQVVLNAISSSSWRGRQQQILNLQQKVLELQNKLLGHCQKPLASNLGAGDPCSGSHLHSDNCSTTGTIAPDDATLDDGVSINSSKSTVHPKHNKQTQGLQLKERNKFEQLEKTNQELQQTRKELKSALMSMKGSKARVETLEEQVKSLRCQIEGLEGKLGAKQMEVQERFAEICRLNQELDIVKDRMRAMRDTASAELNTAHQALLQEKSRNLELQKTLDEYQGKLRSLTAEVQNLSLNLSAYANAPQDELEARKRLQYFESQFQEMKEGQKANENECRRLFNLMEESVMRLEEERSCHSNTQRQLIKSFAVIDQAQNCIDVCLDYGNINDKKVLESIEDLRSMRRELKTGDLYHIEPIQTMDVKKLKGKISILTKEINVLQSNIKTSAVERKKDLQNFFAMVEKTREDFFSALGNAVVVKKLASVGMGSTASSEKSHGYLYGSS